MLNNYLLFFSIIMNVHIAYCPIVLTCQMHTDYMVSHAILIFETYSVVFVRCTDKKQQLDVFHKCVIQSIRTVIAQWSKTQVTNLLVIRSSIVR